jgi:hypothetical protein
MALPALPPQYALLALFAPEPVEWFNFEADGRREWLKKY